MIQRIQTVFLLVSILISVILLYVPAYYIADGGVIRQYAVRENALLFILTGTVGVVSFLAIFLFKARKMQIRLTNLSILLTCILAGLMFFVADTLSSGLQQQVKFSFGCYLPIIQIVVLFLAVRFI